MKSVAIGTVAGLRVTAFPNAVYAFVAMWALLSLVALTVLNLPPAAGIIGALICAVLHFLSEFWHQLGHAWAARRVGYPMVGVRYWWLLAQSIYPKDEPPLPGSIHIRRALGGPAASLLLTVIAALLYDWSLRLLNGAALNAVFPLNELVLSYVALFLFLDNLLVFTIGAMLPLGFTDGSTILRWWGK